MAGVLAPDAFEEAKTLPPVVIAAGSESFLQDQVVRAAVGRALGDPDSPDAVVLHGPAKSGEPDATSLSSVIEDVRTPSMFAAGGRKVVVVRRADLLLDKEGEALAAYAAAPVKGSLLVLCVEGSPAKVKQPDAAVVSCEPPSAEPGRGGGPSPLAFWVAARAKARGKRLDPADAEGLVARSGSVLATLDSAVAAASLGAGSADRITPADLEAVAPRGPAEGTDRFVEAFLAGDAPEALRVLGGLYREGAYPYGAKSPTRGEGPVTYLLLGQARRLARDARTALRGGGPMPPSLRFGCRDPRKFLQRSSPKGLAGLLSDLTRFEADLKGGASGAERARFEAMVVRYAGNA